MRPPRIIHNGNIERVLIGVPKGHKHLRVYMKLKDAALIFQEATIANILPVYLTIITHPTVSAQGLKMHPLDETPRKQGYALHQLLETPRNLEEELRELLEDPT